ncbi:MAG: hypothetical protein ACKO2V_16895, partial [Snowella sp.]
MTATIDIKGMPKAYPTVPEKRQEDYCNSLRYYINFHPRIRKLIFVENSGWPLARIKEAVRENPYDKQIEFISLNCNDFPRNLGKGYGESLLVEKGIQKSKLIDSVTYFAKLTGRIYLTNLTELLTSVRQNYDCLCDYKDQGWKLKQIAGEKTASPHCDTRFLVFRRQFYTKYIQPLHQRHRENAGDRACFYLESQFYRAIQAAAARETVISRFPIEPDFRGIAGHWGGKDYISSRERVKFKARS